MALSGTYTETLPLCGWRRVVHQELTNVLTLINELHFRLHRMPTCCAAVGSLFSFSLSFVVLILKDLLGMPWE